MLANSGLGEGSLFQHVLHGITNAPHKEGLKHFVVLAAAMQKAVGSNHGDLEEEKKKQ